MRERTGLHDLLRERFRLPGFRPGQRALIDSILSGRDALGVLPTGGGKSLCYQVPAALLGGMTVVVTPLLSLIDDQVGRARALGFRAEGLSSSRPPSANRSVLDAASRGALDLLFLAPERLENVVVRTLLRSRRVTQIVVDEAHCISLWGNDFRPAYRKLGEALSGRLGPVLALTATATPAVRQDIAQVLGLKSPAEVVLSFDRPNLHWEVLRTKSPTERLRALLPRLTAALSQQVGRASAVIVYAGTRRAVRAVHSEIARYGLESRPYHAGLPAAAREEAQRWFLDARRPVLVATNAFGMGIDRPDVRLVAHYSVPAALESYYQEAGRAGRDGAPARVLALSSPGDADLRRALLASSRPTPAAVRSLHRTLVRTLGDAGPVTVDRLRRSLPPEALPLAQEAGLRALEAAGGLEPSGESRVKVLPGPLTLDSVRTLRQQGIASLKATERFLASRACRRRSILRYFGESAPAQCEACDRCR